MREVISLQFGQYSNFVGSHLWNLQYSAYEEAKSQSGDQGMEINYDITWREGEKYTPRVLIFDQKGGVDKFYGHSAVDSEKLGDSVGTWKGGKQVVKQESEAPQEREELRSWSNFFIPKLHQKSVYEIPLKHEIDEFHLYSQGKELFDHTAALREEVEDRLRFLVEECDSIGGFQILTEVSSGWGGFSDSVLEYLCDEYKSAPRLTFGTFNPLNIKQAVANQRGLSQHVGLSSLPKTSSVFVPIDINYDLSYWKKITNTFPGFDPTIPYLSSSVLAQAIDICTSLCYTYDFNGDMQRVVSSLLPTASMNISILASSFPLLPKDYPTPYPLYNSPYTNYFLPIDKTSIPPPIAEFISLRGSSLISHLLANTTTSTEPDTTHEVMTPYLNQYYPRIREVCEIAQPLSFPSTFPAIFLPWKVESDSSSSSSSSPSLVFIAFQYHEL
eukprot:TRINITY_DN786_c1_g1_i1.p1 TRINITY_DN786_c1_g1~~TRINITY_DN786_c1_g1_i1.p1  ORF type:complete len:443 (-),score=98.93 TRINITY_DN786_c1_g1_i1:358-1686(-)